MTQTSPTHNGHTLSRDNKGNEKHLHMCKIYINTCQKEIYKIIKQTGEYRMKQLKT